MKKLEHKIEASYAQWLDLEAAINEYKISLIGVPMSECQRLRFYIIYQVEQRLKKLLMKEPGQDYKFKVNSFEIEALMEVFSHYESLALLNLRMKIEPKVLTGKSQIIIYDL